GEQVRELPINGRNFVQLTTLVPGAAVGESFDNKNKGLFAAVDLSFSGSPSVDNQWTVDGAGNNEIGSQRTILTYPSIDGIAESSASGYRRRRSLAETSVQWQHLTSRGQVTHGSNPPHLLEFPVILRPTRPSLRPGRAPLAPDPRDGPTLPSCRPRILRVSVR